MNLKSTLPSFRAYVRNLTLSLRARLLSFRTYVRNLSVDLSLPGVYRAAISILFFFSFNSFSFAQEKIPVFPTTPFDVYTVYASLAIFWLAIIGLIVVIKMKLNEIERIQKLGIDKEDTHAPRLE